MKTYVLLSILPVLIAAAFCDIRSRRIPNWLTYSAAGAGLIFHAHTGGWIGFVMSTGGLFLGLALLIGLYAAGGMGAGDVKLMGALGAILGPACVFKVCLYSAVVGGIYALALIVVHCGPVRVLRFCAVLPIALCSGNPFSTLFSRTKDAPLLRYGVAIALGAFLSFVV